MIRKRSLFLTVLFACIVVAPLGAQTSEQAGGRWSAQRANDWYAKQPWLVGANFIPSDAINELEMFQSETFNPAVIYKELGLGESIGMNTMRVLGAGREGVYEAAGYVSGDRGETSHTAAAGAVRFVLGDESAPGAAASADSGGA